MTVGEVEVHGRFEPLGRPFFPRAADDGFIPGGVRGHGARVEGDDAAPSSEVVVKIGAVGARDIAAIIGVEHKHIGFSELGGGGEMITAGGDGAARIEEGDPFGEEARMIVGPGTVGLRPGANINAERRIFGRGQ